MRWYRDSLTRWENLKSPKLNNELYFPNHDTLIRTLFLRVFYKYFLSILSEAFLNDSFTAISPGLFYRCFMEVSTSINSTSTMLSQKVNHHLLK